MNDQGALSVETVISKYIKTRKILEDMRNKFKVGKKVKIVADVGDKTARKMQMIRGILIAKTPYVITICRTKNGRKLYNISFKYTDFIVGDVKLR